MSEHWLTTKEAATLLGIKERAIQKNAAAGRFGEVKIETSRSGGGKGGQALIIPLSGLPQEAQLAYFRDHNIVREEPENDGWDQEPQSKRDRAEERIRILNAWERFARANPVRKAKTTEIAEAFIHEWSLMNDSEPLSVATLYRWRKDFREGGRMALIPGWGEARREESIDPRAWAYFDEIYGTLKKRTIGDCYRELEIVSRIRGWEIPSKRTVERIILRYPKAYWILRREGDRAFEQQCLPYMERDRESIRGGENWVGDGHELDFFAKGPNGKPARLVLSGWVDMRSVKWMGWHIDYTNNTDIVMAAFARGALNPEIGLPYGLYMDNGREYDNKQFAYGGHRKKTKDKEKYDEIRIRSLVCQLGIETIFAIPKNARAKIIEREFKEVAQLFSKRFATYCGSNENERPENLNEMLKNPANLPDLQTVRDLFDKFIKTERNQRITYGQGRKNETPDQIFAKTRLPIRTVPESVLRLCFMPHTQPLKVDRNGVKFFDASYYNDLLINYLDERVIVRYRNEDLSKVYVFTLQEKFICEAEMKGLSHATKATKEEFQAHKSVKKKAREHIERIKETLSDPGEILTFPEYLDARAKESAASTKPSQASNVVAMVPVSRELLQSALAIEKMEKMAAGGDTYLTYEQQRQNTLRRNRETMEAIARGMGQK